MEPVLEWVKAGGTLLSAVGIYLAYRQLRAVIRWNRVNATFTYLPDATFRERERAAADVLFDKYKINLLDTSEPLSEIVAEDILNDKDAFKEVKDFLNMFENFALAYKAKAVDQDYTYLYRADQFIRYFQVFQPFLKAARDRWKNDMYWIEWQDVVNQWKVRKVGEKSKAESVLLDTRKVRPYP